MSPLVLLAVALVVAADSGLPSISASVAAVAGVWPLAPGVARMLPRGVWLNTADEVLVGGVVGETLSGAVAGAVPGTATTAVASGVVCPAVSEASALIAVEAVSVGATVSVGVRPTARPVNAPLATAIPPPITSTATSAARINGTWLRGPASLRTGTSVFSSPQLTFSAPKTAIRCASDSVRALFESPEAGAMPAASSAAGGGVTLALTALVSTTAVLILSSLSPGRPTTGCSSGLLMFRLVGLGRGVSIDLAPALAS